MKQFFIPITFAWAKINQQVAQPKSQDNKW